MRLKHRTARETWAGGKRRLLALLATAALLVAGACSSSGSSVATADGAASQEASGQSSSGDGEDRGATGDQGAAEGSSGSGNAAEQDDTADETSDDDRGDRGGDDEDEGGDDEGEGGDGGDGGFIEYRSPIAEFLGRDFTDRDRSEAEIHQAEAEAEIKTAECMQEQGFEYIPRDSSEFIFFAPEGEIEPGSDEWIETYGFGITTQRFPQSMVGPDLVGTPDEMMGGPFGSGDGPQDPNQEYIESLSPTARDAYFAALHGEPPDFDPSSMTEEEMQEAFEDFVPTGCANEARQDMFGRGGPFGPDNEFFDTFGDEMQNLYERIESDPRIVAAQTEVGNCVAERGLSWTGDMEDLFQRWDDDLNKIGSGSFGDPFLAAGLAPEDMSQEEIDDFFSNLEPPQLNDEDKALLAELQREEVELAMAVRDCGGGPRDLQGLYNEVRIEYEERFLAENAETLEPFRNNG